MKEIVLPENSCPLCEIKGIKSLPFDFKRKRMYNCPNCGTFQIEYMAYRFTPIITDQIVRARLSYFIRHHSSEEDPVIIHSANYKDLLSAITLPSVIEQLDNFLLWFGDKSDNSLDTVDGNTKHLIALFGCKNQIRVIQLLDQLFSDGYIVMENPTSGPLRERSPFDLFAAHLTKEGINKIQGIKKMNVLSFYLPEVKIEELLNINESNKNEIKGSFRLDLNRLIKGDGIEVKNSDVAKEGVLKAMVGFLNASGGNILIGAIEKSKFQSDQLKVTPYTEIGPYYVIGIKIEEKNNDKYELDLRNLISSYISNELVELIDISFPVYDSFILCLIKINRALHQWYYLDNQSFYVREGNRTIELKGTDSDSYKKRNPR